MKIKNIILLIQEIIVIIKKKHFYNKGKNLKSKISYNITIF